jgi:hypothetical protein
MCLDVNRMPVFVFLNIEPPEEVRRLDRINQFSLAWEDNREIADS